jgi:CoA:oxalate CoA-transferase
MDGVLGMLIYEFQEAQFPQKKRVNTFQPTRAKDGFIMIACVKQNNFDALARAIGRPEWMSDPRFASARGRSENWSAMMAILDEWASARTAEECEATLTNGGVPCSRYFTVREALEHPHLAERKSFSVIDDGAGELKVPNPAFKFNNANAAARNYVPALGADNADVLSRVLGYSKDRIAALYEQRILHDAGTAA